MAPSIIIAERRIKIIKEIQCSYIYNNNIELINKNDQSSSRSYIAAVFSYVHIRKIIEKNKNK